MLPMLSPVFSNAASVNTSKNVEKLQWNYSIIFIRPTMNHDKLIPAPFWILVLCCRSYHKSVQECLENNFLPYTMLKCKSSLQNTKPLCNSANLSEEGEIFCCTGRTEQTNILALRAQPYSWGQKKSGCLYPRSPPTHTYHPAVLSSHHHLQLITGILSSFNLMCWNPLIVH